jgi:hypothetical protein
MSVHEPGAWGKLGVCGVLRPGRGTSRGLAFSALFRSRSVPRPAAEPTLAPAGPAWAEPSRAALPGCDLVCLCQMQQNAGGPADRECSSWKLFGWLVQPGGLSAGGGREKRQRSAGWCGRRPGAGVETAGGYCGGGLPKDRRIEET